MINILFYRSISEDGRNIGKARLWQRQARSEGLFSQVVTVVVIVCCQGDQSSLRVAWWWYWWYGNDIGDDGDDMMMMTMVVTTIYWGHPKHPEAGLMMWQGLIRRSGWPRVVLIVLWYHKYRYNWTVTLFVLGILDTVALIVLRTRLFPPSRLYQSLSQRGPLISQN